MDSRPGNLLIIDDERCNRRILAEILKSEHTVFCASSGNEAFALLAAHDIDLILLDVVMPEMDGYEVCRRLKEDPATEHIPVLFVTSKDDPLDETRGLDLGAIDYLIKPVHHEVIRARVRNHLALKRYAECLTRLSFIDGLTGIANRRYLDERLQQEWRRALREDQLLSLLLIDIDFFKKYNDFYGHLSGDDSLRQVASAIARSCDLAARYGGEEFTVLLPGENSAGAIVVAQKIMQAIAELNIIHAVSEISPLLTVSIGIATMQPCKDMTTDTLLKMADRALYKAKSNGRNRFHLLESLVC